MGLKEDLIKDLDDVFFNTDEFAEIVHVDGVKVEAIISNSLRKDSKKYQKFMENNYSAEEKTYTIKSSDFEALNEYDPGDRIVIDNELYRVYKITKDAGVTHIEVKIYD